MSCVNSKDDICNKTNKFCIHCNSYEEKFIKDNPLVEKKPDKIIEMDLVGKDNKKYMNGKFDNKGGK